MTTRPWNTGELKVLRMFASLGSPAVAELLERSVSSVEHKARELNVSMVATGDDFDLSITPEQIMIRLRDAPNLNVCPLCGVRLAIMKSSGMCRVCHLDQLISVREARLVELARERRLTKLRQEKRRLRICECCGMSFFPRVSSDVEICPKCEELR